MAGGEWGTAGNADGDNADGVERHVQPRRTPAGLGREGRDDPAVEREAVSKTPFFRLGRDRLYKTTKNNSKG